MQSSDDWIQRLLILGGSDLLFTFETTNTTDSLGYKCHAMGCTNDIERTQHEQYNCWMLAINHDDETDDLFICREKSSVYLPTQMKYLSAYLSSMRRLPIKTYANIDFLYASIQYEPESRHRKSKFVRKNGS